MFGPVKALLFATNLSEACRPALETAIAMATQYHATLVLLHVMDKDVPSQVEEHLKSVMGEERLQALLTAHEQEARDALIGKMSSGKMAQKAMRMYCAEAGIEADACDFEYRELVVPGSPVADTIASQAGIQDCDLIILGSQKGFRKSNAVGSIIKGVLRQADVPVLVVPPRHGEGGR